MAIENQTSAAQAKPVQAKPAQVIPTQTKPVPANPAQAKPDESKSRKQYKPREKSVPAAKLLSADAATVVKEMRAAWSKIRESEKFSPDNLGDIAFDAMKPEIVADFNARLSMGKLHQRFVKVAGSVLSLKAFQDKIYKLITDSNSGISEDAAKEMNERANKAKEAAGNRKKAKIAK